VKPEIIDLRTINPWDRKTVLDSIEKTHNLMIVHEAVKDFGVGAEISAVVAEEAIDSLDGPIVRIGAPFAPPSVSRPLEAHFLVDTKQIVDAVCRTLMG
jgi:pyruvate dehydrogenase E1 component beta subunit